MGSFQGDCGGDRWRITEEETEDKHKLAAV